MFCPQCGNSCSDAHKFCSRCGKPLPTQPVPEDAAAVTVPAENTEVLTPPPAEAVDTPVAAIAAESPIAPEMPVTAPPPPVQPKKGRLWPPLVFLIIMTCVGLAAFLGNRNTPESEPCFTLENGMLYFDYSLYTGPDELTIPAIIDGVAVTAISDGCFAGCDRLTTVIIPDSVTTIGTNAFSGCDSLRGLYIPNSVTSIGAAALYNCPALEALYIPESILTIGARCLDGCDSLRYIIYEGTYSRWLELYNGSCPPGMELHTHDGVFYAQP